MFMFMFIYCNMYNYKIIDYIYELLYYIYEFDKLQM